MPLKWPPSLAPILCLHIGLAKKFIQIFSQTVWKNRNELFGHPDACKFWSLTIKISPSLAPFPILIPQIPSAEQFSLFPPTRNLGFLIVTYPLEFPLFCHSLSFYCFTQVKPQIVPESPPQWCLPPPLSLTGFSAVSIVRSTQHNKQFTKYTALLFLNQENNNILAWGQGLCLIYLLLRL